MKKKIPTASKTQSKPDGFVNIAVSNKTREGLHHLKKAMSADSQEELLAKLVAMALAIEKAVQK